MPFHYLTISAWPYHQIYCSAYIYEQTYGKDRENFISCSFNIIYFLKYVKITKDKKSENYTSLAGKMTNLEIFYVDQNTGNMRYSVYSGIVFLYTNCTARQ